jgi:PKHD-type hydroxylase
MFLEIDDLLNKAEVSELVEIAARSTFVDGRASNPANLAKQNLQIHDREGYAASAKILTDALFRSREFVDFAFPKIIAPPMITRYDPGMAYGPHSDIAFLPMQRPLRTDLSATIFLADPASYDGGELSVQLGTRAVAFKGAAGSVIVYPSHTMHQVTPVTRGSRLAAITFIESQIASTTNRETLYELNEVAALEGLNMALENYGRLQRVQNALRRLWADAG